MPDASPVLRVSGLGKAYGELRAVDGLSFEVAPGEIVGLLGPNGAGKSTAINMLLGVLAPNEGTIVIDGIDLARNRTRALGRTNFAAVAAQLPGNMRVEENLRIFGLLYEVPQLEQRLENLLEEFNLSALRHAKCGVLSSGEQTRVAMAKAMLNRPRLLLLDEPTASLDPSTAQEIRARICAATRDMACGVLWTSHNMHEVEEVCDRVLFLSRGRLLLEGDPKTLPQAHGHATLEELFIAVAREPLSLSQRR